MKNTKTLLPALALTALLTMPVLAQDPHDKTDQSKHSAGHAMPEDVFKKPMMDMHEAMNAVKPTGNTDVDFVRNMIPHHQGAIDMARVELAKGRDPAIRKMAADIIKAQEEEIAVMKKWLAENSSE